MIEQTHDEGQTSLVFLPFSCQSFTSNPF